ncbi:MAG: acyl-CoA dehydratase activase-related protein, partial [Planctomycetes bacterium]|nr:acyl-CoA dehydratase activase-related protein [Planctomycetota bacterium]
AKIVNSHIFDLINQGVDRIFYPIIVFENAEFDDSHNTFNCPIVSGYPEVIRSSINPEDRLNVPYDTPAINFGDKELLKKACIKYFKQFKINKNKIEIAFDFAVTEQDNYKSSLIARIKDIADIASKSDKPLIILAGRPYHADKLINHDIPTIISDFGANVINENIVYCDDNSELGELFILSQWSYPNRLYKSAKWVSKHEKAEFVQLNSFGCGPDAITIDECKDILASRSKNHTLLRIDEMTSTGSVKLRIRSLIESLKLRQNKRKHIIPRKTTRHFKLEDKKKVFIAPNFSPFYSFFVSSVLNSLGFTVHDLPVPDDKSLETGLKYVNNEICYPAIVIVGDVIKVLQSGKYNPEDVYVGITETGGQCRASTYSALLRKGLVNAGFENVPVITLSTGHNAINNLSGFDVDQKKLMSRGILSILYADSLAKLYYSTAFREKEKGISKKLLEKYLPIANDYVNDFKVSGVLSILRDAVAEFNNIDVKPGEFPRIGIVGEIFVKYNPYGNRYTVDWLIEQGIEVVVPPLIDFFTQKFVNTEVNIKEFLKRRTTSRVKDFLVEKIAQFIVGKFNGVLGKFRFFDPIKGIRKIADEGKKILSLVHQIGEGWLIPAEIVGFAEQGINNVISFQPFGCLANHIVAKGMERKIRDLYPDMNLLYVDIDAGTSDVNFMNRLHFMINSAKNSQ